MKDRSQDPAVFTGSFDSSSSSTPATTLSQSFLALGLLPVFAVGTALGAEGRTIGGTEGPAFALGGGGAVVDDVVRADVQFSDDVLPSFSSIWIVIRSA